MIKIFLRLVCIVLIGFQFSCGSSSSEGEDSVVSSFSFEGQNIESLIKDLNDLDLALSLNQLLQKTPENRKILMLSAIENARAGALTLVKFGTSDPLRLQAVFDLFTTAIGQYDSLGVLNFEQSRFDKVFNKVKELRMLSAKKLGLVDDYTWVLFNHNFADGIEPYFTQFKDKRADGWVTNFQTDIPKAKVQGRSGYAWIVSKPISLKGIKNPSFRYFTQFTVVAPNPKDSLNDVVNKVFQTYVILDLKPGEDPESLDSSRKIKMDYEIDDLPLARNFHDAWMPQKSLEEYRGHKVSIAFLFDVRKIKEAQYYIWDVFDFEFHGSGVFEKPASVYAPNFSENLGGFRSLSLKFGGESWKKKGRGPAIESGLEATDAFLLSPRYFIPEDVGQVSLSLTETLNVGSIKPLAQVLVSTDFRGGKGPLAEGISWETLSTYENNFERQESLFDLSKYKGKNIVLAFRFQSEAESQATWSVDRLHFRTTGADLTELTYSLPDLDERYILYSYDAFSKEKDLFKMEYDENLEAPKWRPGRDGFSISGYVKGEDPAVGGARIVFAETDLTESKRAKIRLVHMIKYMNKREALKVELRLSCKDVVAPCPNMWEELSFPEGNFRKFVDEIEATSWVAVPEGYQGAKVEFSLFYKGSKGNTPRWTFQRFDVGELKEGVLTSGVSN